MSYVFKLPPTIIEDIMRYAIGYPRDRLRAIAADVVRTKISVFDPWWKTQVSWSGAGRGRNWIRGWFFLTWRELHGLRGHHLGMEFFEYDRKYEMRRLQEQCEPCEPVDLELQRTHL